MNEFNMIWICYMYGWFHGLRMMSWYGFDMKYE